MNYKQIHITATKTLDRLVGILESVDVWPTNRAGLIKVLEVYASIFYYAYITFESLAQKLKR